MIEMLAAKYSKMAETKCLLLLPVVSPKQCRNLLPASYACSSLVSTTDYYGDINRKRNAAATKREIPSRR